MTARWHTFGPEALYWAPRHVQKLWGAKEIYITENGCAATDERAADGKVYDTDRIMFLRDYLTQLQRATAEGVPVNGYFLWSRWTTSSGTTGSATGSADLRRLQDAEADAEAQRRMVPRGLPPERGRVAVATSAGSAPTSATTGRKSQLSGLFGERHHR